MSMSVVLLVRRRRESENETVTEMETKEGDGISHARPIMSVTIVEHHQFDLGRDIIVLFLGPNISSSDNFSVGYEI